MGSLNSFRGFDIIFTREYLRAALLVSLLSVWVLVGLFYYLNRYTKRYYFNIWTAAWLFYALWLTIGISAPGVSGVSFISLIRQWCVSISSVFLLWGSLAFLEMKTPQSLFALFMVFLLVWGYAGRLVLHNTFDVEVPTFVLIGMTSMFAGVSFYRLRQRHRFVAVGMLFLGFFLWGIYLMSYPFSQRYDVLINVGLFFSAVLQLFIAVSMIVLVLEEARHINEAVLKQINSIDSEKRELQLKVLSAEEKCRSLFQQASLREDLQSAYDELRETQQSVMQQERLRALGQMASGIAHDINNALSPILAFAEMLLRRETSLSESARKQLENIRTSAEDIAQIVARMGEFYRRRENSGGLHLVSMNSLVEQVVTLTSPCWRDISQSKGISIRLQTNLSTPLPELYANESELREALTNLVLNAVDALPEGGTITHSTRAARLGTSQPGEQPTHLIVEVTDDGIGMDEKTRLRCLEPFFSTKRQRGGSGLGLAMVYGTMERHEGSIEVQSEPAQGSTFRLILPIREQRPAAQSARPATVEGVKPLRILCIDDEPLLRELLREVLGQGGHEVQAADGGQAGLERFSEALKSGRPFDVVVTDLGMPGVNGREVAERIKAATPNTPIILLTGWGSMLEERGEPVPNVDAVLSKPPRVAALEEAVVRVTCQVKASPPPGPSSPEPAPFVSPDLQPGIAA